MTKYYLSLPFIIYSQSQESNSDIIPPPQGIIQCDTEPISGMNVDPTDLWPPTFATVGGHWLMVESI